MLPKPLDIDEVTQEMYYRGNKGGPKIAVCENKIQGIMKEDDYKGACSALFPGNLGKQVFQDDQ